MARSDTLWALRESFKRELSVYGFKKISYLGELNAVLQYHRPNSSYYIEVIYVAAVVLVREQDGDDIEFTRFYGFEEALAYIDSIFN